MKEFLSENLLTLIPSRKKRLGTKRESALMLEIVVEYVSDQA